MAPANGFTVFNAEPRVIGSGRSPQPGCLTAAAGTFVRKHRESVNTSLLIVPYVIGNTNVTVDPSREEIEITAYYASDVGRIFVESNYELLEWELFYVSGQKILQGRAEKSMNRASFPAANFPKGFTLSVSRQLMVRRASGRFW